jgi:hypothetical protein
MMRVKTALIMVTDIKNIEDAKEKIEEIICEIMAGSHEPTLWDCHPDIRLATRSELEELAAAGALLPDPGVIEVKKPKKKTVTPGMKFNNGSTIKTGHAGKDPVRGITHHPIDDVEEK